MAAKNSERPSTPEQIYQAWDEALGAKAVEAAVALYAPDATIESPLVNDLLGVENGVCKGREALRHFIQLVFERMPAARKRFRKGYFTDGKTITWEYPRVTPDGDQMDLVEVMELKDGLIQHHRVYWGWFALQVLRKGEH